MNHKQLIERLEYYATTYAVGDNLGEVIDGTDELLLDAAYDSSEPGEETRVFFV